MFLPPVQEKVRDLCGSGLTSMDNVIEQLARLSKKPINLVEVTYEAWGSLTSFKVEFDDRINIYYPPQNSIQYKIHCIYHELGHVYLESIQGSVVEPDISREILRDMEGAVSVSCRFIPDSPVEQWVEKFAFEMARKTRCPVSGEDPNPFL